MMVDYFVLTQLIIDDVRFPDRAPVLGQLGGGVYAVAGMRVCSENVGFCCAGGPDYGDYSGWFVRNRVDVAAAPRKKRCIHSAVTYFENGERSETPLEGYGDFQEMLPLVSEIPASYESAKGMYFYKDCDPAYWRELTGFFGRTGVVPCWEIDSFYADAAHLDEISACLPKVELFSTNLTEGKRMTGQDEPAKIAQALLHLGADQLLLRLGAQGSLVADRQSMWRIPAAPTQIVDVTGGGNSSTGAFLAGYCESGGDLIKAGVAAGIAASFILRQYGVPSDMDAVMAEARGLKRKPDIEKINQEVFL